jgi:AcrR family transcriptional regulator
MCYPRAVQHATRERILDGAAAAVARHGLAKLDMGDVSATSGVARGTLYRYFPSRQALLAQLARREGLRFKDRMLAAIADAPSGPERVLVALQYAATHVREHGALQRLLETDPAFLLRALREWFPRIKAEFGPVLAPLLQETGLVRGGVVTLEHLLDWMMRLMVSAFLLPHPNPDEMAQGLAAVYRILTVPPAPRRRAQTARATRGGENG